MPGSAPVSHDRLIHNRAQREYFDEVERPRLAVEDTPYVRRHVDEALRAGHFSPGASLLDVGAGIGKGSVPLLERGFDVTANDLSPVLLDRLHERTSGRIDTLACDIIDLPSHTTARFDGAVGFFVLHHLVGFDDIFRGIAGVLKPGARVAFCEPVAWNPLYYAQILCTPRMTFAGERSLSSMWPRIILPAMRRAGFDETASRRYGYFPPALTNRPRGRALESWLERRPWLPFPHAFQVFSGRLAP